MSNRAASILAIAAVISSLCIYATFAQAPEVPDNPTSGAIVIGQPPHRLGHNLPGRYQLEVVIEGTNRKTMVVLDTNTGECWLNQNRAGWHSWGSPVKPE